MVKGPTDDELEAMAKMLAFVANRTGMTVEKCEQITDDAAAMLRACKGRVRVKALEWVECKDGTLHDPHCQYELETDGGMWRVTKAVTGGGSYVADCDTLAAAKAAAQADYKARILAALDPAPDNSDWNAAIEAVGRLRGRDVQKRDAEDVGEAYDLAIDEAQDAIRALKKGQTDD